MFAWPRASCAANPRHETTAASSADRGRGEREVEVARGEREVGQISFTVVVEVALKPGRVRAVEVRRQECEISEIEGAVDVRLPGERVADQDCGAVDALAGEGA